MLRRLATLTCDALCALGLVLAAVGAAFPSSTVAAFLREPVRALVALALCAALRALVESRAAWWALLVPARGPAPWSAGAAGGAAAGLGLGCAWALIHPVTLTATPVQHALSGALLGALGGLLAAAVPWALVRDRARAARAALPLGALAAFTVLRLAPPVRDWVYARRASDLAALGLGLAGAAATALFLASAGRPRALRHAATAVAAAALLTPLAVVPAPHGPASADPARPRAVLLVTIDTLRADHVGAYGYARPTTPRLDAFARDGVLFERAFAPMTSTDPSHTAILTGLPPRSTGVMANGLSIARPGTATLGSIFRAAGYRTGAITSRSDLDPVALRLAGFESFCAPSRHIKEAEAERTLQRAVAWIDAQGDAPYFLWVHFWDPHNPYDPPAGAAERTMFTGAYRGPVVARPDVLGKPGDPYYDAAALDYATGLYDGEIHYADARVGRLIDHVRERAGAERALVVVTADHGESIGELEQPHHFAFGHGYWLNRQEMHVPLIVSWPGHVPRGTRVADPVSLLAIAPTAAATVGTTIDGGMAPLPGLGDPHIAPPETVYAQRQLFEHPPTPSQAAIEGVVVAGERFYRENATTGRELFGIDAPLVGAPDLATQEPDTVQRLGALLRGFFAAHPPVEIDSASRTQDKRDALRGLGYVD